MNVLAGVLILIVGFGFHWLGQLICVLDWDLGTRLGIAEEGLLPEYKVYEHGIALADVALGWIYGLAGVGLILDAEWGFKLAWFPGVVMIYHGLSFWAWTRNRRRDGHRLTPDGVRVGWIVANLATGVLAVLVAWNGN